MSLRRSIWFCAFFLATAPTSSAVLIDDFNDGDAVGWSQIDGLDTGGPALFDASAGSYQLASTGLVSANENFVATDWTDSLSNPFFTNGILTARVVAENSFTSVTLAMRSDGSDSGYGFVANNDLDSLFIVRSVGLVLTFLASAPFSFTEGTEYFLQASAFGADLSFSVWEASAAAPENPLIAATDSTFSSGGIGLTAYKWGSGSGQVSARFDDVVFTPEPGTAMLVVFGLAVLAVRRRTHVR